MTDRPTGRPTGRPTDRTPQNNAFRGGKQGVMKMEKIVKMGNDVRVEMKMKLEMEWITGKPENKMTYEK